MVGIAPSKLILEFSSLVFEIGHDLIPAVEKKQQRYSEYMDSFTFTAQLDTDTDQMSEIADD